MNKLKERSNFFLTVPLTSGQEDEKGTYELVHICHQSLSVGEAAVSLLVVIRIEDGIPVDASLRHKVDVLPEAGVASLCDVPVPFALSRLADAWSVPMNAMSFWYVSKRLISSTSAMNREAVTRPIPGMEATISAASLWMLVSSSRRALVSSSSRAVHSSAFLALSFTRAPWEATPMDLSANSLMVLALVLRRNK